MLFCALGPFSRVSPSTCIAGANNNVKTTDRRLIPQVRSQSQLDKILQDPPKVSISPTIWFMNGQRIFRRCQWPNNTPTMRLIFRIKLWHAMNVVKNDKDDDTSLAELDSTKTIRWRQRHTVRQCHGSFWICHQVNQNSAKELQNDKCKIFYKITSTFYDMNECLAGCYVQPSSLVPN